MAHETSEIDRTQAAAAIRGERLLRARIGRLDFLAVIKVVVRVHTVQKQYPRFRVIVGGLHDLFPQIACARFAIDPLTVYSLIRAGALFFFCWLGEMHQFHVAIGFDRAHERICYRDRNIKVGEIATVLGVDECFDIGMVAAQYTHLRATARAGRFHRLAGAVEHTHVGNWT